MRQQYIYLSEIIIDHRQRLKEARLPSMRLHVIFLMKCSHQAALLEIHAGSTSKTSEFLKLTNSIQKWKNLAKLLTLWPKNDNAKITPRLLKIGIQFLRQFKNESKKCHILEIRYIFNEKY